MKFVTVRDLRGRSKEIWRQLRSEKEMVITLNGRPIAILSRVSEGDLEESLSSIRQARAVNAAASIQEKSVQAGTHRLSLDEVNVQIHAERKSRS